MKNYRITRRTGENTTIQADSFDIHEGFVRFFREVKQGGKNPELIAVFANVESVEEQAA